MLSPILNGRRLQSRERQVEMLQGVHSPWKTMRVSIALSRTTVDMKSPWIRKAHDLRDFIKAFSRRVVPCTANEFIPTEAGHCVELECARR